MALFKNGEIVKDPWVTLDDDVEPGIDERDVIVTLERWQAQRDQFQAVAAAAGAEVFLIDCVAPEAVIRERLEQRMRTPGSISDGRVDILPAFQKQYEPVQTTGCKSGNLYYLRVDTTQPAERCVQQALAAIQERKATDDLCETYSRGG